MFAYSKLKICKYRRKKNKKEYEREQARITIRKKKTYSKNLLLHMQYLFLRILFLMKYSELEVWLFVYYNLGTRSILKTCTDFSLNYPMRLGDSLGVASPHTRVLVTGDQDYSSLLCPPFLL